MGLDGLQTIGLPAMFVEPKLFVHRNRYNSAEPLVKLTFMANI